MKALRLILISVLFCYSNSVIADEYYPLVEEGKVWEYYQSGRGIVKNDAFYRYYRMEFKGTTEINGITYHNLYVYFTPKLDVDNEIPVAFVREEDKKVYALLNEEGMIIAKATPTTKGGYIDDDSMFPLYNTPEMLENEFFIYDFNTFEMPTFVQNNALSTYQNSDVEVEVGGNLHRAKRFVPLPDSEDDSFFYFIEGIGHSGFLMGSLLFADLNIRNNHTAHSSSIRCVYNADGDIIYKSPRYMLLDVGVEEVKVDNNKADGVYYNLMGQPVSNPSAGIYIRNGKKVVVR